LENESVWDFDQIFKILMDRLKSQILDEKEEGPEGWVPKYNTSRVIIKEEEDSEIMKEEDLA
jgi:hypothetical protein